MRSGDLVTIEVAISHPHLPKNKKRGYIHSTQFPFMRRDNFVIFLTTADGSRIINYERVFFKGKEHVWTMVTRTGEPMTLNLVVHVRSDAYKGIDVRQELAIEVVAAEKEAGPSFNYAKHDLKEIAKKTILGQEVIINPEDQDSDEDLEDEYKHEQEKEEEEDDD